MNTSIYKSRVVAERERVSNEWQRRVIIMLFIYLLNSWIPISCGSINFHMSRGHYRLPTATILRESEIRKPTKYFIQYNDPLTRWWIVYLDRTGKYPFTLIVATHRYINKGQQLHQISCNIHPQVAIVVRKWQATHKANCAWMLRCDTE